VRGVPLRRILFGLYAAVCLASQTWPGYAALGNAIEPWVLGVPLSLAWVAGWIVLSFVALVAFDAAEERARSGD
jgi:hypothetical protein